MSSMVSPLLCLLAKQTAMRTVTRNLHRAFPEKSDAEIHKLSKRYFRNVIDYLLEFVKQNSFSEKTMKKHVRFENIELLHKVAENNKLIICYSGHLLNFEWMVSLPLHAADFEMSHIYLSTEKGGMIEYALKTRSRYGAVNIPSKSPLRYLQKVVSQIEKNEYPFKGLILGTLADMDTNNEHPHLSDFFDHKIEMLTGSERMGRNFGMAFIYARIKRTKRGYYSVAFEEMKPQESAVHSDYPYTDTFMNLLERDLREQPDLWMLWGEPRF